LHYVDGLSRTLEGIKDIEEVQNVTLQYSYYVDRASKANLYDMIHPNANKTFTVRSVL
jgi:hypothetical protein